MTAEANAQQAYWDSLAAGPTYAGGEEEWGEEEWYEEEGEYEVAYHQNREAEQENNFGAGVRFTIADTTEGHTEDAVLNQVGEGQERGEKELAPEARCGGSREGPRMFDASSGLGHREYVHGEQCPKNHNSPWYKRHDHPKRDPEAAPKPPPLNCPEGTRPSVDPRGYPYCAPEGDGGPGEWGPEDTPEDAP